MYPPPLFWCGITEDPMQLFSTHGSFAGRRGDCSDSFYLLNFFFFLRATPEIKAVSKNIVHVNQRFPSESNIFLVMELRMPVYLIQYLLKFLLHDLTTSRCGQSLFVVHDNRWFLGVFCWGDSTTTASDLNNWTINKQCHNFKPIFLTYCILYIKQTLSLWLWITCWHFGRVIWGL